MRLAHTLIIGQTESGKTTLCKRLSHLYKAAGLGVVVLDRYKDPEWACDWITRDADEFLAFVKNPEKCLRCALFVDEAGLDMDRYSAEWHWLATNARHHGHATHFLAQRAQMVHPNVRANCSILYAFNVNPVDAKIYALDFNAPIILEQVPSLAQGEFIRVSRMGRYGPPIRKRLW